MFVYCGSNPINRVEINGNSWTGNLFGSLLEAAIKGVINAIKKQNQMYIEENYKVNSKTDSNEKTTTKNSIIYKQNELTEDKFVYGNYPASYNSCEAIAVHNAKVLLRKDSTLSETIRDIQETGAMFPHGELGTNPLAIGMVLDGYDMSYTTVGLNSLEQTGVYIISYWTEEPFKSSVHTVAVYYSGSVYSTYNKASEKMIYYGHPSAYAENYLCGYYLGEIWK